MNRYYSAEKQVLILLSLLKKHGIRRVVASPGSANMSFVASLERDPWFEVYSCVDERSACYLAIGMSVELGEPVVLTCTGATASRNYLPGLTEAFYRKVPILAVTATQNIAKVGHHIPQVIDRSILPKDAVVASFNLPMILNHDDFWECEVKVNEALLALRYHGGGPVHLNLPTNYSNDFSVKDLPDVRMIERVTVFDQFPELRAGRVGVLVGSSRTWAEEENNALDQFCETHNAAVFCDHTSGYFGKYRLQFALLAGQERADLSDVIPDLLIHIGEITGDYYSIRMAGCPVWRVNCDGKIRDTFRRLRYVFDMPVRTFFEYYAGRGRTAGMEYYDTCRSRLASLQTSIPEVPFSNIWLASKMARRIPDGSVIYFGILNSLRSWNFFELPASVRSGANVGGFGIDGGLSTAFGASLVSPEKLVYCVIGDLAFFYDMNVLGNRHIGKNLRILLVNNGKGVEFRQHGHRAFALGEEGDQFVAAAGHFGRQSRNLVRHYAQDLGFRYITASNKSEAETCFEVFLNPDLSIGPILFEVFTDAACESKALEMVQRLDVTTKEAVKEMAKKILGERGVKLVRKIRR